MANNRQRIFGLDLMRATAIMMVLFAHTLWIFPESNGFFYQILKLFGFLGVEIFFVLSGFLIGKILYQLYLKDNFSLTAVFFFLKRRWFRTVPSYFLVLLLNIIIASIIGYSVPELWRYFFFLQNFKATMLPFFPESWSLSVEEYAYVILPFFLLLLSFITKPKNKPRFFILAVSFLILLFFSTKMFYQNTTLNTTIDQWNVSLKSVVLYRLDSIFIGVFCSWIYSSRYFFWIKNKLFFVCFGTLIFGFLFAGIGYFGLFIETNAAFWNVIYLPLVSVAVACFLPFLSEWKEEKSLINKPIAFISIISYSIYLLHYSVILQLMKYYASTAITTYFGLYTFAFLYILITVLVSSIFYRFYEKPMTDIRDKN